jgi:hypothetical protein
MARTGYYFRVLLTLGLEFLGALAFAPDAAAQDVGCEGDIALDSGHEGATWAP